MQSAVSTIDFFCNGWTECNLSLLAHPAVPDVEVKGESATYFLLVQGSDDIGCDTCKVRMLHSDAQINGAAAMATASWLLRQKTSSGILLSQACVCLCVNFLCVSSPLGLFV